MLGDNNKVTLITVAVILGALIFTVALWADKNGNGEKGNIMRTSNGHFKVEISKKNARMLSQDGKLEGRYTLEEGKKIFDYCISRRAKGCDDKLLIITGNSDQEYGDKLDVVGIAPDGEACSEISKSMKNMNPHNIQTADVDGNGMSEISITMYKSTRFHPVMAERPYIYYWGDGTVHPMWRGSRLSRPFRKYIFCDLDGDKTDELIAIEYLEDGRQVVNAYSWKGFGFESIACTNAYDKIKDIEKRVNEGGQSCLQAEISTDCSTEWIDIEFLVNES